MYIDRLIHLVIITGLLAIVLLQVYKNDDYQVAMSLLFGYLGRGAVGATINSVESNKQETVEKE